MLGLGRLNEAAWPCRVRPFVFALVLVVPVVSMKRHGHAVCAHEQEVRRTAMRRTSQ